MSYTRSDVAAQKAHAFLKRNSQAARKFSEPDWLKRELTRAFRFGLSESRVKELVDKSSKMEELVEEINVAVNPFWKRERTGKLGEEG